MSEKDLKCVTITLEYYTFKRKYQISCQLPGKSDNKFAVFGATTTTYVEVRNFYVKVN